MKKLLNLVTIGNLNGKQMRTLDPLFIENMTINSLVDQQVSNFTIKGFLNLKIEELIFTYNDVDKTSNFIMKLLIPKFVGEGNSILNWDLKILNIHSAGEMSFESCK